MKLHISKEMIEQIAEFEGCRLEAYKDIAGIPTIGIGHTGKDVVMGDKISLEEAYRLFREDISRFEDSVNKLNNIIMSRSNGYSGLSQRQFDALVSLVYNTGSGAIGNSSTLYHLLTTGKRNDTPSICHAFMLWVKITDPKTGKKVTSRGLENRRAREAAWYVYGSEWKSITKSNGITDIVLWAKD